MPQILPQRIGHARAFAMLGLGERMNAREALAAGLANRVLAAGELEAAAMAAAIVYDVATGSRIGT